jgi:CRP/FNR family transcriptional regulator
MELKGCIIIISKAAACQRRDFFIIPDNGENLMSENNGEFLEENLPFWNELGEDTKNLILGGSRSITYKKDNLIYSGSGDLGVVVLRRGRAYAYTVTAEGREFVLLRLFSGDFCLFGFSHAMVNIGFPIYIYAETEAEVMVIDSSVCAEVCKASQGAETFLRQLMAKHFSDVVINMQNMLLVSAEKRIAAYICAESDRTGNAKVRATHEQIAKCVGTAREVVSRTLGRLATDGAVELGRGVVIIRDKVKLQKLI